MAKVKDVGMLVRAAGFLGALMDALMREVEALGGTMEHIHALVKPEGREKLRQIAAIVVGNVVRTTANFSRSIAELVTAGGYNYANPAITDDLFPREPNDATGEADVVYDTVDMRGEASLEKAWAEMERRGLRKPTARETLVYGENNPNAKRRRSIVGGVSAPDAYGYVLVLVLYGNAGYRELKLDRERPADPWDGDCVFLFLAVRKS